MGVLIIIVKYIDVLRKKKDRDYYYDYEVNGPVPKGWQGTFEN
jgi:hypothetical protein